MSGANVRDVVTKLTAAAKAAPAFLRQPLDVIVGQLGTADTSQVVASSKSIAAECRARGLAVPETG